MNTKETEAFSVSQLSEILKGVFSHPSFTSLRVYGEVYSIKLGKFSYMDLGDQGHKESNSPILKCAFRTFYGDELGLEDIKVGDVIEITGALSYYPHGSSLTFWGNRVKVLQNQLGKTLLEKKRTLEKLDKLGYLDPKRKRPIPKFCKKVAILTAQTGAAYQDILKTLHMRFPCDTVLYPTTVQGEGAASSIVMQLNRAARGDYDVILLGRGGGSKTDLSCFDDEKVALAIATCPIPVITCIGHTIDTAIADRVSDAQAITPTEGASLINPSLSEIQTQREGLSQQLKKEYHSILQNEAWNLHQLSLRLNAFSPKATLLKEKKSLLSAKEMLQRRYRNLLGIAAASLMQKRQTLVQQHMHQIENQQHQLQQMAMALEANNPENYAKKGLALILKDGKRITSSQVLKKDDLIEITYIDGRKEAKIV